MSDYWFKPKPVGYGARPSNWKGWMAVAGFIFVQVALASLFMRGGAQGMASGAFMLWFAAFLLTTWAFIRFCKSKSDGEWKWRTGREQ